MPTAAQNTRVVSTSIPADANDPARTTFHQSCTWEHVRLGRGAGFLNIPLFLPVFHIS
jgi:hypothetical protein